MKLKDKAIIVTGSTTGIGEAIARRFAAEGARVLIHGRDAARAKKVAASLGDAAAVHVDDLADAGAAVRLARAARQAFGRIDGIVNNAAHNVRRPFGQIDAAYFDQVIAVNLRTPILLIQEAREDLIRARGCVLNIGSVQAYCGQPIHLVYASSKGALVTMTRNLANQLADKHVRVNLLNVGWTLTENEYRIMIGDGLKEGWPDHVPAHFAPTGRIMKPEEVASVALFWMCDDSRPVTGSIVDVEQYPVSGGRLAIPV